MPRITLNTQTGEISSEYRWINDEAKQTFERLQEFLFSLITEQRRSAQLLHAPVGSVEGSENSKDIENDRSKACSQRFHNFASALSKECPNCGERLSS